MTPKQAYRIWKSFQAGLDDPMTKAMGAGEFVSQSFSDKVRKLGMTMEDVYMAAEVYMEARDQKRNRFKDPARLRWKQTSEISRTLLAHSKEFYA